MKVALSVWAGRIAPVFDVSRELLILTVERGEITARTTEDIDISDFPQKVAQLVRLEVATLICGAVSRPLHRALIRRGVRVVGFVAGEIDEVVTTYLAGDLPTPELSMPGCCRYRNRKGKRT